MSLQRNLEIRDTLFGDLPLDEWPAQAASANEEPWASFVLARTALAAGRRDEAQLALRAVLAQQGLEARHYLEAWEALRSIGVQPQEQEAKHVLGVVTEVPIDQAFDLLAAYADHSARYYNHAGGGIVWDHPDDRLDAAIDGVLVVADALVKRIGPWQGQRPPPPPAGHARLSILTPSGLHFGQGPFSVFVGDPIAAPLFNAAAVLFQKIIALSPAKVS